MGQSYNSNITVYPCRETAANSHPLEPKSFALYCGVTICAEKKNHELSILPCFFSVWKKECWGASTSCTSGQFRAMPDQLSISGYHLRMYGAKIDFKSLLDVEIPHDRKR